MAAPLLAALGLLAASPAGCDEDALIAIRDALSLGRVIAARTTLEGVGTACPAEVVEPLRAEVVRLLALPTGTVDEKAARGARELAAKLRKARSRERCAEHKPMLVRSIAAAPVPEALAELSVCESLAGNTVAARIAGARAVALAQLGAKGAPEVVVPSDAAMASTVEESIATGGAPARTFRAPASLSFSPRGDLLLLEPYGSVGFALWSAVGARGLDVGGFSNGGVVGWVPDSDVIGVRTYAGVEAWSVSRGAQVRTVALGPEAPSGGYALSHDGRSLAAAGGREASAVFEASSGKRVHTFPSSSAFDQFRFGTADGYLIGVSKDRLEVFDPKTWASLWKRPRAGRAFAACRDLFVVAEGGVIERLAPKTGAVLGKLEGLPNGVSALACSGDDAWVAGADGEGHLLIWSEGQVRHRLEFDRGQLYWASAQLAFSPNARVLAVASDGGPRVDLWDVETGRKLAQLFMSPTRLWADPYRRSTLEGLGSPFNRRSRTELSWLLTTPEGQVDGSGDVAGRITFRYGAVELPGEAVWDAQRDPTLLTRLLELCSSPPAGAQ